MPRPVTVLVLVLLVEVILVPSHIEAQRPGPAQSQATAQGWPPAMAGLRAGYDYNSTGSVVGLQLRIAALRSGHVEVVPNGEITFLTGLREYQGGVDAVFVSGGRRGGLYAGGGIGWRNTLYEGPGRETRLAPTLVAGARSSALFGPFGTQIEMRWSHPDGPFKPRSLTLGLNFNLWGRNSGRR